MHELESITNKVRIDSNKNHDTTWLTGISKLEVASCRQYSSITFHGDGYVAIANCCSRGSISIPKQELFSLSLDIIIPMSVAMSNPLGPSCLLMLL